MHLKTDELIDRLYGLESVSTGEHLDRCADCRSRWNEMLQVKAELASPPTASNEFLAAQRRNIYARLGEERKTRMAWAPALAAAALLAIGVAVYRPAPAPVHLAVPDAADAQLFADVYSMEQAMEPSVAAPIHTMFEENQ